MTSRILICGATGMLGTDLVKALGPYAEVIATGSRDLDITDAEIVNRELARIRPTLVINSAGFTNVDAAETERAKAHRLNALGPANLAAACAKIGTRLFHYSTDQVFDGNNTRPWKETDEARPSNHYGATKREGEIAVLEYPGNVVLRVQWLYGELKDRFTAMKDKKLFTPFDDQFGAPTWTRDICTWTRGLIDREATGLFHAAHDDYASWYEIFDFVRKTAGYSTELIAKKTDDVILPARRPKWAVMSNEKLCATLGLEGLGSWREPLAEFLRLKNHR